MPDLGWLFSRLADVRVIADVLVVALIIYWLLWVAQGTRALHLISGIVTLFAIQLVADEHLARVGGCYSGHLSARIAARVRATGAYGELAEKPFSGAGRGRV